MSRTRTFTLPSTQDERQQLVAEIARNCSEILGYPAREANLARWNELPITELRRVAEHWRELMLRRKPELFT